MRATRALLAWYLGLLLATLGAVTSLARAQDRDFSQLSLEQLMNEPVTSVSKKETRLGDSAAAITVITPDDMRRLGITAIPEALRLVPGFDVARIDASHWAISVRGFNLQYANTLLVLIDGRSVYTPSFGGVYWDSQDVPLEDLDRIEVIRGPGATLWGANAVNGVVNVITKRAKDTQGTALAASFGTEDRPGLDATYGGTAGSDLQYRVYAKYFDREGLPRGGLPGDWRSIRSGFRADWQPTQARLMTLQGDYYSIHAQNFASDSILTPPFTETVPTNVPAEGYNVVGRWTQTLSDVSHLSVQAYVDSYSREQEARDTADLQVEHRFALGRRNDIVWGIGYRFTSDSVHSRPLFVTVPAKRDLRLYTAFVQDEVTIVPGRVRVILGTKLEHNDFTGLETQPSLRALWTLSDAQTLWASASRAVSTPARVFHDSQIVATTFQAPGQPVTEVAFSSNPDLPSQKLNAYELGYRVGLAQRVSADVATFYNVYRSLYGSAVGAAEFEPLPLPHIVVPLIWDSSTHATSYGVDMSVSYEPLDTWRLTGTYTLLHMRLNPSNVRERSSPAHEAGLRSYATLTPTLELNAAVFYVDPIESAGRDNNTTHIPSYTRVDAGLLWQPTRQLAIGAWGQNLLGRPHAEIQSLDTDLLSTIPRSALVRVTLRF